MATEIYVHNDGVDANTIDQCKTRWDSIVSAVTTAGTASRTFMVLQCGINSIGPQTGAQVWTTYQAMVDSARTAGIGVVMATITAANGVTAIEDFNALLRAYGTAHSIPVADTYAVLVTSKETNDALRTDAPVNNALVASTTGGYKDGHDGLWKYTFIDYNFRGLKLAIDPKPLRFNQIDGNGFPILLEPYLQVSTNAAGLTWKTNPAWSNAAYEVDFMFFARDAFARLTPQRYSGEGMAKWPAGMFGGELNWLNILESCNPYQDFGWFQYRIIRAVQPQAPHYVAAILAKRCRGSFTDNTDTCADISDLTL